MSSPPPASQHNSQKPWADVRIHALPQVIMTYSQKNRVEQSKREGEGVQRSSTKTCMPKCTAEVLHYYRHAKQTHMPQTSHSYSR